MAVFVECLRGFQPKEHVVLALRSASRRPESERCHTPSIGSKSRLPANPAYLARSAQGGLSRWWTRGVSAGRKVDDINHFQSEDKGFNLVRDNARAQSGIVNG